MAKVKTVYQCSECGGTSPKWQGQCGHCQAWNTLSEVVEVKGKQSRFESWAGSAGVQPQSLGDIPTGVQEERYLTGNSELDRVLGGGLVRGSVVLLGGDPGIGKSTLVLQALGSLSKELGVLYVSGEESLQQIASRAKRLQINPTPIKAVTEIQLEKILSTIQNHQPKVVVIDSIQTMYSDLLGAAPGSVSQVRECASQLTRMAKQQHISVILIGHVTKDGTLAGPRVLEHLVDTVLYFEGDPQSSFRVVRAFKNRFGAINEMGAFEMSGTGLIPIDNPSALFLSMDRTPTPGSSIFIMQEGQRPLLIDIQALVDNSALTNPRRLSVGVDYNRVAMLLGILNKHGGVNFGQQDIFVNAVGGIRIQETAVDLPICLALFSSIRGKPIPIEIACFGEIGLTGEIRPVQFAEDRIKEAAKLGFKKILLPKRNLPKKDMGLGPDVELRGVKNFNEVLQTLRQWGA